MQPVQSETHAAGSDTCKNVPAGDPPYGTVCLLTGPSVFPHDTGFVHLTPENAEFYTPDKSDCAWYVFYHARSFSLH